MKFKEYNNTIKTSHPAFNKIKDKGIKISLSKNERQTLWNFLFCQEEQARDLFKSQNKVILFAGRNSYRIVRVIILPDFEHIVSDGFLCAGIEIIDIQKKLRFEALEWFGKEDADLFLTNDKNNLNYPASFDVYSNDNSSEILVEVWDLQVG